MAISFPSNIKLNAKLPLDERQVVANSAARLALKYVYSGLIVFEEDTQKLYLASKGNDDLVAWNELGRFLIHGYYYKEVFYEDNEHLIKIEPNLYTIYIDDSNESPLMFIYNKKYGEEDYHYICMNGYVDQASETTSGIARLYNSLGNNTNGSCTQKIISEELNRKVSVEIDAEQSCLIFK